MSGRWMVECQGEVRAFDEVDSPEFLAAAGPLRELLERAFSEEGEGCTVRVVFFVHRQKGICFRLIGKPEEVRRIAGRVSVPEGGSSPTRH